MSGNQEGDQSFSPAIRRARLDNLTIYEVSDAELNTIEKGSPDSIYLTIAVALLSSAISFLGAYLVTDIPSVPTKIFFAVFIVVGFVVGVVLLILWLRSKSSVSECIQIIRGRLPPEGVLATPPYGTQQEGARDGVVPPL